MPQRLRQTARGHHHVNRAVPTKHRTEPLTIQQRHHWPVPATEKALPLFRAAVLGLYHQPRPTGREPFPCLGKAGNRLARTPGQAEMIDKPPRQRRLQTGPQIRGNRHRPAGSPCEGSTGTCDFYHIPPRAQPDSPAGQPCGQIGNNIPVGTDHEADHLLLGKALAGHRTTAQRAALRLVAVRRPLGVVPASALQKLSRGQPPPVRRRPARQAPASSSGSARTQPRPQARHQTNARARP